jgi:hypothetical protein
VKTSRHLFAILALGTLSAEIATAAEQPGLDAKGGTPVTSSVGDIPGKSPSAGAEQGSGAVTGSSPVISSGADHANEGAAKTGPGSAITGTNENANNNGVGSKTPAKPGAATGSETGNATDAMHEPIDTQIAVNQGRRTTFRGSRVSRSVSDVSKSISDFKDRLLKKSKTATAPATAPPHHGAHRLQQNSRSNLKEETARNAVGANIEHVATPHHEQLSPTANAANAPSRGPAGPGGGMPLSGRQGPTSTATPGPVAATNPISATQPINHHDPGAHNSVATPAGSPGINGTGMIRPRLSATAIGGPKVVWGVLNGTSFRAKHP